VIAACVDVTRQHDRGDGAAWGGRVARGQRGLAILINPNAYVAMCFENQSLTQQTYRRRHHLYAGNCTAAYKFSIILSLDTVT